MSMTYDIHEDTGSRRAHNLHDAVKQLGAGHMARAIDPGRKA